MEIKSKNKNNLIALHGLLNDHTDFINICNDKRIKERFNSHLLDIRNHGSSFHNEKMGLNEIADDVEIYLKKHKFESFYIMAHSMGARAILRFLEKKKNWFNLIKGVLIIDVLPTAYKNNQIILNSYEKVTKIS